MNINDKDRRTDISSGVSDRCLQKIIEIRYIAGTTNIKAFDTILGSCSVIENRSKRPKSVIQKE